MLRPLAQRARGPSALRVALDHAVRRVGRVGSEAGEPQREAVSPQGVAVFGDQQGRLVGDGGVERSRRGTAARHDDVAPAPAADGGQLVMVGGKGAHRRHVLLERPQALEPDAEDVAGGLAGVGVAVDEPGQHEASAEVDEPRGRVADPPHVVVAAHGYDASLAQAHRLGEAEPRPAVYTMPFSSAVPAGRAAAGGASARGAHASTT